MELMERKENMSISILDSVDVTQVQQVLAGIEKFQAVVQKTLKAGHDYDVIPGTLKPTLLKPGAEKILMLLGLTSEYEILEKIEDYDKGIFAYTVRCILSKSGRKVTEGLGSANSKEDKYRWRWVSEDELPPGVDKDMLKKRTARSGEILYKVENDEIFSQANTILKMAKKRAQIDAVLTVAALSEIFTQDIEDMKEFMQAEQVETLKLEEAGNVKVNFGKYKGKTIKEIHELAPDYVEWLAVNAREEIVKKAANMVLDGVPVEPASQKAPQKNQSTVEAAPDIEYEPPTEELPF